MPEVINKHHYRGQALPPGTIYIGRPSPLGNPFTVKEHGQKALDLYREWLWKKIRAQDRRVMKALREIQEDSKLMCYCAPRPCHGDVVVKAWAWLQKQKEKTTP